MKQFDLFGSQISLYFQGKHTHKTKLGALITFSLISLILARLFYLIQTKIQGNQPTVLYQERITQTQEKFIITPQTFQLALGLKDLSYNYILDEQIFTAVGMTTHKQMILNTITNVYEPIWTFNEFQLEKCTLEHITKNETLDFFLKSSVFMHYCLPLNLSLEIEGEFNSDTYSDVTIFFKKCSGDNCKSDKEINNVLDSHYVEALFTDVLVSPENKNQPFQNYARDLFWYSSQSMPHYINMYLRNNFIDSDFGWLYSDISSQHFPSYSFQESQVMFKQDDVFFKYVFRFEKHKENYYQRFYQKIPSMISEIGGFTQIFLAGCILICSSYSKLHLNKAIIDETFNFQEIKENSQIYTNNLQTDDLLNHNKNKSFINFFNNTNTNNNDDGKDGQDIQKNHDSNQNNFNKNNNNINSNVNLNNNKNNKSNKSNNYNYLDHLKNSQADQVIQNNNNNNNNNNKNINNNTYHSISPQQSPRLLQQFNQNLIKSDIQEQLSSFNQNRNSKQTHAILENPINSKITQILKAKQLLRKKTKNTELDNSKLDSNNNNKQLEKQLMQTENKFKKLLNQQNNTMKFNIFRYFISYFCRCLQKKQKQKKQIIDYTISQLYEHFDIQYLIKRLIELDKLKRIILDDDQLNLFEFLPKPSINYSFVQNSNNVVIKEDQNSFLYRDKRHESDKMNNALLSFHNIVKKKKFNKIDLKLINFLDDKIFQIQRLSINQNDINIINQDGSGSGSASAGGIILQNEILSEINNKNNEHNDVDLKNKKQNIDSFDNKEYQFTTIEDAIKNYNSQTPNKYKPNFN